MWLLCTMLYLIEKMINANSYSIPCCSDPTGPMQVCCSLFTSLSHNIPEHPFCNSPSFLPQHKPWLPQNLHGPCCLLHESQHVFPTFMTLAIEPVLFCGTPANIVKVRNTAFPLIKRLAKLCEIRHIFCSDNNLFGCRFC